jgi:hypothetical protein
MEQIRGAIRGTSRECGGLDRETLSSASGRKLSLRAPWHLTGTVAASTSAVSMWCDTVQHCEPLRMCDALQAGRACGTRAARAAWHAATSRRQRRTRRPWHKDSATSRQLLAMVERAVSELLPAAHEKLADFACAAGVQQRAARAAAACASRSSVVCTLCFLWFAEQRSRQH